MKHLFITGGCGFIGSNFVRLILRERPAWRVTNFDLLTYSGNAENLADMADCPQYRLVRGDVADASQVTAALAGCDAVVHFAAESHVDRSILDSSPFVRTNVAGTQVLLDCALAAGVERYIQISTDEVYGALTPDALPFTESTPLAPRNPYAATKAGADCLALAYYETHGLPVMVTRCPNNYGPYQFPEKLIPLMIINALHDEPLPVYGDGRQVRDWIHVEDHNRAILRVLEAGRAGEVYHVGAENEHYNLEIVESILERLGKPATLIRHVADRKGHDRRYAMALGKLRDELGWQPQVAFTAGLAATIDWYATQRGWWERVRSGAYREFYARQYAERLGA
jgi:dTDP-glucose 4,6-dehydratase